jgi:tRNA threonylcarbamoyladenosine biosynthesis protein TsaE
MTQPHSLDLPDEAATVALGETLAGLARPGDVICLHGTLGTGKSTLARAFVRALTDPDEEVPSPTFTLVQTYETEIGDIWHFDLYRLDKPADAFELGIEEAFAEGICLIEWPDRLGRLMPRGRLDVELSAGASEGARRAVLTSHAGAWDDRWGEIAP